MAENRQAVRNDYLQQFKKLKKAELKSMQYMIISLGLPGLIIFSTVETLIDKLTIEGSIEKLRVECFVYQQMIVYRVIWFIFAYRWWKYVREEQKLMKSEEHPMMTCDERKFKKNLESLSESINSLNKKWIAVYILLGTVFVLQSIFALLRIRDLYLERSKFH